jgi:hypothetical protein
MAGPFSRLSKDYEGLLESSEAMIYVVIIHLMLRRLSRIQISKQFMSYRKSNACIWSEEKEKIIML